MAKQKCTKHLALKSLGYKYKKLANAYEFLERNYRDLEDEYLDESDKSDFLLEVANERALKALQELNKAWHELALERSEKRYLMRLVESAEHKERVTRVCFLTLIGVTMVTSALGLVLAM